MINILLETSYYLLLRIDIMIKFCLYNISLVIQQFEFSRYNVVIKSL